MSTFTLDNDSVDNALSALYELPDAAGQAAALLVSKWRRTQAGADKTAAQNALAALSDESQRTLRQLLRAS